MSTCTTLTLGRNCNDEANFNITAANGRGLCILTGATPVCKDVCDPQMKPTDYSPNATAGAEVNVAYHLLVQQIRDGKNLNVKCCDNPPCVSLGFTFTDWCPPGSRCGGVKCQGFTVGCGNSDHAKSLPEGRGICIVDANGPEGRYCADACDYSFKEETFLGTTNAWDEVQAVRNSGECPHFNWWPIILIILLCCILIPLLGFVASRFMNRRRKRQDLVQEPMEEAAPLVRDIAPPPQQPPPQQPPPQQPLQQIADPNAQQVVQRDLLTPPEQPESPAHWQGPIPGMDQPHLAVPVTYAAPAQSMTVAAPPVQTVQTVQPQTQSMTMAQPVYAATPGYSYRTATVAPTTYSQPAVAAPAFSTQVVSQPGSMQVQPPMQAYQYR